jgi:hypothetical protein
MPVHPSTWEYEAGGPLVQGQPGLHSKTLPQNKRRGAHHFLRPDLHVWNNSPNHININILTIL